MQSHPLHRVVILAAAALAAARTSSAAPIIHSVTGSGYVEEEGIAFEQSIAAHQDDDLRVWGTSVVVLDLTEFELGKVTFRISVDCLDVDADGDSAWVGGLVEQSTNDDIVPVGLNIITLVRDLGGNGEDILHGEPFPPDVLCGDRPDLLESVVLHGNFHVR